MLKVLLKTSAPRGSPQPEQRAGLKEFFVTQYTRAYRRPSPVDGRNDSRKGLLGTKGPVDWLDGVATEGTGDRPVDVVRGCDAVG